MKKKKVVVLTLWNSVAESEGKLISDDKQAFPIISATALAYSPFRDASLGSTPSTVIVVDPQIPEAQNLSNWRMSNMKNIAEMIGAKNYFAIDDSSVPISGDDYHTITEVVADDKLDKFLVKVGARITDPFQKFFYMGCNNCHSGINADFDYAYTCIACKEDTQAKPREKVQLNIYDDSGSLNITVFGEQTRQFLEMDAVKCMELHNSGEVIPVDKINNNLSSKHFMVRLRKKKRVLGESTVYQYTAIQLQEDEMTAHTSPPDVFSKLAESSVAKCVVKTSVVRKLLDSDEGSTSKDEGNTQESTIEDSST